MLTCSLSFSPLFLLEQGVFIVQIKVMWKWDYGLGEVPVSIREAEARVLNIHCPATFVIILMTVVVAF